jgi:hypothetical protein
MGAGRASAPLRGFLLLAHAERDRGAVATY